MSELSLTLPHRFTAPRLRRRRRRPPGRRERALRAWGCVLVMFMVGKIIAGDYLAAALNGVEAYAYLTSARCLERDDRTGFMRMVGLILAAVAISFSVK